MAITLNGTTGITTPDISSTTSTLGPLTQALNLGSTGQIVFPATQNASSNANTLDDYEEGTFTPYFANQASSTYQRQNGRYVKIGKVVYFWIDILLASQSGTSGGAQITGLPFTSVSGSNWYGAGVINGDNNWATPRSNLGGAVAANSTTLSIWYNSGTNLTVVNMSDIGSLGGFYIGGSYLTS